MNNIVLCGFMGCGKTTVGKRLAQITGNKFIDLDLYIEEKTGLKIKDIFAKYGEDTFRDYEHSACKEVAHIENAIISTGGGALTFERNCLEFKDDFTVFLDCPFSVIESRIKNDKSRPLMNENAQSLYTKRRPLYQKASNFIVNADNSVEKICELIIDKRG